MQIFTRSFFLALLLLLSIPALAQPVADFTATPVTGCAPLLVQFTSTSTGNPTSYQWNLGNGVNTVIQNPSTTYTTPGTYTVTLTVSNANGSDTKTVTNYITVHGNPQVSFTVNDTATCPPLQAVFTNNSVPGTPGAATYSWSFGDGNNSTLQNPSHTYPVPGYYHVTLVVTNSGGCVSSLTKPNYIHVRTPPVVDFTASPTSSCDIPVQIDFTSMVTGSGPYTYNWTFGDGGSSTNANPNHTYNNPGAYNVRLIVTDVFGCKDTMIKPAYINVGSLTAAATPPAAGCENTPIQFTNGSSGATSYLWDFGDGNTSTDTDPSHVYSNPGSYTVKLVAYNAPCADSITFPLTINPKPEASFNFTPDKPCPAPQQIQFNNTSTGATSYTWSFGDGGSATTANPTHTYNADGFYTVTLTATSAQGCTDTLVKPDSVRIYDLILDAGALPSMGCVPLEVHFSSATYTNIPPPVYSPYPYETATWFWDFGDGNTSTLDTPIHTYTVPGTYTVTLNIVTENGCTAVDSFEVRVGTKPNTFFTAAPLVICNNETVYFTNLTTGATSYLWDFGDGGATGAANPSHTYSTSGWYPVTLHGYNNGCDSAYTIDSLILVHPPTSKWEVEYNCDTPLMVQFYDTMSIEPTSHIWFFGDGNSTTATNPSHTYSSLGTYLVTLVTFNNIYNCSDTLTKEITLVDPQLTFVTPDTAICRHDSIIFTPTYTGIATRYGWYVNGVFDDTVTNFGYRFNQNGVYTIMATARDIHACWDTAIRTNYVLVAKPTADFTANPPVGCLPLNVTFTDNSTNTPGAFQVTRDWDFGNGNTASVGTGTTSELYSTPGIYTVTMIVTDNVGCKDTLEKTDYIEVRQPVADFVSNDVDACIGQSLQFSNTSQGVGLTSEWTFGDGNTSSLSNPSHSYSATGVYTVRLIVTDASGCKDTIIKNNYINIAKPDASFQLSDTLAICPPLNVVFTNTTTGAATYSWTFGTGGGSSLQHPVEIFTDPGLYNVTMIATSNQGCKDTAEATVNVLGYAGGLTYTPVSGCEPLTVDFTATIVNVPSLIWDFSDGVTVPATSPTISHTYTTPGAYVPKLILSDGLGCLNSSEGLDTIKVDGILPGFLSTPLCVYTPIEFTDTSFSFFSPIASRYWSFNNGQGTSTSANPTYQFSAPGAYPVTLIVTNANGCKDTLVKNVVINPLPVVTAGPDTTICPGDVAALTANGAVAYAWEPLSDVTCPTCQATSTSPTSPSTFTVTGTDINGCVNRDSVMVNIQYITTSFVDPGGEICEDSLIQLRAWGAQTYEWKPAEFLDDHTSPEPIATPDTTTIFTVYGWEGSCPPDSHKIRVTVHPKPVVSAGADRTIIAGKSVMLNIAGTGMHTFLWSPGETLTCTTCSNPTASPDVTTTYRVLVTSIHGCKASDTVAVKILCDESQVFIPNLFSPNGDGQNDRFFPRGEGLKEIRSLRIYNRWGELVYQRSGMLLNDEASGWDGTQNGRELNPDVFVYVMEGVCITGDAITWKGDVTLMR